MNIRGEEIRGKFLEKLSNGTVWGSNTNTDMYIHRESSGVHPPGVG